MAEKIRVAFFAEMLTPDFDGAARTMYQLLNRIDKDQFEFLFICGTGPASIHGFPCVRTPSFTLPVNRSYQMALPFLVKKKLYDALEVFDPMVIHIATPSFLGQFALKYAQRNQLPVLTIYHTHFISYIDYYFAHAPFLISPLKSKIALTQKVFYNQCNLIYVPSKSIADELKASGIEEKRMKSWKRGIDTRLFDPEKRNSRKITALTGNQQKNILFVSRLVWEKNLETLFRIYEGIQAEQLPYNLIVAGDGIAGAACKKYMPAAVFTGKLSHEALSELYASADVFLFPSVSEAYGNVVLEAMASGLPCIVADGGGTKDFITQGANGFACKPYDAADYIRKIKLVLEYPQRAVQFRENGLQYSRKLDWNALSQTYFSDIRNLALHKQQALPLIPVYA